MPKGELGAESQGLLCELEKMVLRSDEDRYFQVGTQLPPTEKEKLIGFLRENLDVFAWSAYKAPRIDPSFV